MKPEFENIELIKNETEQRFEMHVNCSFAFIEYKETTNKIALTHTESPETLQGTGAGTAVVEKVLAYVKASGKLLQPFCPFVFAYIKRHTEWKAIADPSYPGFENL